MKRGKPLRRESAKRRKESKSYRQKRMEYLHANIWCEVCGREIATQIHHRHTRGTGGKLDDKENFVAVCFDCHMDIHKNPKQAIINKLIKEV